MTRLTARKLKIEQRRVDDLVPYAQNARLHSKQQVEKICESIRQFGFNNPVLIDADGVLVAGHGRLQAAKRLELETVPAVVLGHLTDAERRAYRLADNRIALDSTWDEELLKKELADIVEGGVGLDAIGFGDDEVERLLNGATGRGQRDPDDAPDAEEDRPVTEAGDMWCLGEHRIICGDSTDADTVGRVLAGERPHLMVTDPPYGVEYDPSWRGESAASGKVLNDDRADWTATWKLFPGKVAYVWHGALHAAEVHASLEACKFAPRSQIVWVKQRPVFSRGHYHWQHEAAYYATKPGEDDHWRFVPEHEVAAYAVLEGKPADWAGGRKQSTVWFIEHVKNDTGHGTQKPVECMRRPIINNSDRGDAVYEPFSGSGTTIIAADMVDRRCFAVELNPAYVDVAVRRWQEFRGAAATLDGDGRTFDQVRAAREAQ